MTKKRTPRELGSKSVANLPDSSLMGATKSRFRFEDLLAWQKARKLVAFVYALTSAGQLERDFGLRSQIQRAAVSVMSNIAEGFDRRGPREFAKHLSIAQGSCGEVKSLAYVLLDLGYVNEQKCTELISEADDLARLVGGLARSVRSRVPALA